MRKIVSDCNAFLVFIKNKFYFELISFVRVSEKFEPPWIFVNSDLTWAGKNWY